MEEEERQGGDPSGDLEEEDDDEEDEEEVHARLDEIARRTGRRVCKCDAGGYFVPKPKGKFAYFQWGTEDDNEGTDGYWKLDKRKRTNVYVWLGGKK